MRKTLLRTIVIILLLLIVIAGGGWLYLRHQPAPDQWHRESTRAEWRHRNCAR